MKNIFFNIFVFFCIIAYVKAWTCECSNVSVTGTCCGSVKGKMDSGWWSASCYGLTDGTKSKKYPGDLSEFKSCCKKYSSLKKCY